MNTRIFSHVAVVWEKGRSSLLMAVRSLWLHKMRAFLSVLGIIIGTSAVISLMAFGEGSMQDALEDIKRQGATNIIITSVKPPDKATTERRSFFITYGLTRNDYEALESIPTITRKVPMRIFTQEVRYGKRMKRVTLVATTDEYEKVNRFKMAAGRFLRDADNRKAYGDDRFFNNVVVLGAHVAEYLFPFTNPIGKAIKMSKHRYVVVGVMAERSALGGGDEAAKKFNNQIYMPYDTCMARIGRKIYIRQSGSRSGEIVQYHQITVSVDEMSEVRATGAAIEKLLQRYHGDEEDWDVAIPLDKLELAEQAKERYLLLLRLIASISLLVGGIGIMNIMLATVTERTREIGIRRALGAKRKDITLQFIVEAVVQTSIGGLFGVLLGLSIVYGLPALSEAAFAEDLPAKLHVQSIFWSLGIAVSVGVLFGYYPARRASRLDPIEALRHV